MANIILDTDQLTLTIQERGETNTAANIGTGDGDVYASKTGAQLQFRTIAGGTNITVSTDGNNVVVDNDMDFGAIDTSLVPTGTHQIGNLASPFGSVYTTNWNSVYANDRVELTFLDDAYITTEDHLLTIDTGTAGLTVNMDSDQDFTLTGNMVIQGDLDVNGTVTTIDTTNLLVEDAIIMLNRNGTADADGGIIIERGTAGDNAAIGWNSTADRWEIGTTTNDSTSGSLAITLANMAASTGTFTNVNAAAGNITTVSSTTVGATTGNITTVNATTVGATTGNITTVNATTLNAATLQNTSTLTIDSTSDIVIGDFNTTASVEISASSVSVLADPDSPMVLHNDDSVEGQITVKPGDPAFDEFMELNFRTGNGHRFMDWVISSPDGDIGEHGTYLNINGTNNFISSILWNDDYSTFERAPLTFEGTPLTFNSRNGESINFRPNRNQVLELTEYQAVLTAPHRLWNVELAASDPVDPDDGAGYINTGDKNLYVASGGGWDDITPETGAMVFDSTNNRVLVRIGSTWHSLDSTAI